VASPRSLRAVNIMFCHLPELLSVLASSVSPTFVSLVAKSVSPSFNNVASRRPFGRRRRSSCKLYVTVVHISAEIGLRSCCEISSMVPEPPDEPEPCKPSINKYGGCHGHRTWKGYVNLVGA